MAFCSVQVVLKIIISLFVPFVKALKNINVKIILSAKYISYLECWFLLLLKTIKKLDLLAFLDYEFNKQ